MSRTIRALVIGGGLLAAALFGSLVLAPDAVVAEIPQDLPGDSVTACPNTGCPSPVLPDGCLTWAGETLCPPGATPEPTPQPTPEPIVCSITEGCDVPVTFVTEAGEVVKTLVIRLQDVQATPVAP